MSSSQAASSAVAALRARIAGEVDDAPRRLAEYSSDASNYRVVPTAVVFPRTDEDVAVTLETAREHDLPMTARGAGTSVAGNAIGPGLVLDFSRYLNRIVELDPRERTARIQPGVVLSSLQRAAATHGLRFGPDPSTQDRCTLGGMLGNNACGPRAVAWGRTADNVRELRILDGAGRERELADDLGVVPGLDAFVTANLATLRTELGRFDRQASGFSLEHLLPERGGRLARAFVGTEGACGLILEATVDLVQVPTATALAVLGYPDMPTAADDVPALMAADPFAVEGIDARLVDVVRKHKGAAAVPELPRGGGWLFVEMSGGTSAEAVATATELCRRSTAVDTRVVPTGPESAALWRIRADGVGLSGRTRDGRPAWPGWEDAAVPQHRLGRYLRDFEDLTREHGVDGLLYGHFGDGCVHVRLDFPFDRAPQRFRTFLLDAAALVASHGGSMSGEHGDGRARSELLPLMYSPAALSCFAGFKALFDPAGILNPGVVVDPALVDADLRVPAAHPIPPAGGHALTRDGGDLSVAVHRCVGIGKCRADTSAAGGFMCPSYLATRDEKDVTRGRARVLQEVVNGSLVAEGFRSPELAESLDLCLSCKACASDCPAGVDMATYKSEALYRRYRGRPRPLSHYTLGQLPRWTRVAALAPRFINGASAFGPLRRSGLRLAGLDPRREIPGFATQTFRKWWRRRPTPAAAGSPEVLLWIDTFTDAFSPEVARAAVTVLEGAGYQVLVTERRTCCGLTWISTGQLDGARRQLAATLDQLQPHLEAGRPIVGLEPSCTAVLRSDLLELLPDDPRSTRAATSTHTLAEFLTATVGPDGIPWSPPNLAGLELVVQPHCHQHAVLGFAADRALLERAGARVRQLAGCCGLAGNFGMERGHYEVSVAVAETGLLPALAQAPPDAVLLADGFSCRTQAVQLAGREGMHLAQLLAGR
ncbi:FAD-binding protein [Rhodococcus spelaei]|uniref:FAD-binding protein n=1 Tax=Rhodococcus spelaei TaxID=2546320 RepID=A0A541B9N2_9NOCA|nr:FAD-binding and (Fe-S)-binding domain-containing protein [Rhodococcus spelaei]TQF69019.1 FAD-binding protein [Rhodococcus spelaei]